MTDREEAVQRLMGLADEYGRAAYVDEDKGTEAARAALESALREALQPQTMSMRICEATRLVLRLGQPYVFTEDPECESCRKAAGEAREAYGPDGGAPQQKDSND